MVSRDVTWTQPKRAMTSAAKTVLSTPEQPQSESAT